MSAQLNVAALQRIGDGADVFGAAIGTSAANISIPANLRGSYVRIYASVGTIYLSAGPEGSPTTATALNGFEVAFGTPEQVYIPAYKDNQDVYLVSAIASEAANIKIVRASS